ncbi:PucR family transcriptional regulator [Williamsia serinedens]|uniref:PucR C-terminal helix-turn-helix domain-containing protein n=1 Tax=Williamsia serinedens TaxID=391736 RepID=A0ABT1H773_9NOCA|nr:helix-turn-helix domain-containing protein [Williamsia serinedens]MCP2163093.1 PucR C-terminal helix-turn-helix domain-containing protein [Williamsia serinedens]
MRTVSLDSGETATPQDRDEVRDHVVAVAESLNAQLTSLVGQMRESLASQIVELNNDPSLVALLGSSIEGNVDTILHALQHDISGDGFEPPAAAVEYARRLAQWGVPVNALVRAYRLGQQFLLARAFDASLSIPASETVRVRANAALVDSVFEYIDWISQRVVSVYETERESWLADRESARLDAVLGILAGTGSVDVLQRVTGYRVLGRHLALVAWSADPAARRERLQRFTVSIRALAAELGSTAAPLVVVRDGATAWAWIQLSSDPVAAIISTLDRLSDAAPASDAPRFAVGTIATGVEGFIRSHRQALRTHHVAVLGPRNRALERYDQPGLSVVDLCAHDPAALRAWVRSVLGDDLAADTPNATRLRDTLRIYLACDRSLNAAATAMTMHKNSIRYRVDNAEKMLPAPLATDRLAVEVALAACHWLGPAVER